MKKPPESVSVRDVMHRVIALKAKKCPALTPFASMAVPTTRIVDWATDVKGFPTALTAD